MITPEKLDEIIENLDIVSVVSRYVALKKSGRNYKGICPFHAEKTPSFYVSPEKQIFHCFGCGAGGNVVGFLMKIENLSFIEAATMASEMAGVELPQDHFSRDIDLKKKTIFETNKIAMKFFQQMLYSTHGVGAVDFLEKRGINRQSCEKFAFGYAPAGNKLYDYIIEKKLPISDFKEAGLIIKKETRYADVFKQRVILPIFDWRNNVVGFGGRCLDEQQPKYLNTSENYVFKKGNIFYGLNWAKEKIKTAGFSIIVEGYFDLVKMHLAGFSNTIASLGTALTDSHLRILKRWTNKILLVFDSDSAGSAAAYRSLESIIKSGFEVKIGVMPTGFDPEDFLDNYGCETLKNMLNQSKDFVEFAYQFGAQKYSLESARDKSELTTEILKLIKNIPDEIEKNLRVHDLAKMTGIDEQILLKQISLFQGQEAKKQVDLKKTPVKNHQYATDIAEKSLIGILLNHPEWADEITEYIDPIPGDLKMLIDCIKKDVSSNSVSKILNKVSNPQHAEVLTEVAIEEKTGGVEMTKKIFYDCIGQLCRHTYKKKCDELNRIIKQKQRDGQSCEDELKQLQSCLKKMSAKNSQIFTIAKEENGNEKE